MTPSTVGGLALNAWGVVRSTKDVDAADFTPGHIVQGEDGETVTVCPARND